MIGCTRLDCIINDDIRQELGVQRITEISTEYKHKWRENIKCSYTRKKYQKKIYTVIVVRQKKRLQTEDEMLKPKQANVPNHGNRRKRKIYCKITIYFHFKPLM